MQAKPKINTSNFLDLIIKTWIFYLFFVFLTTELLSLFNLISRTSIIIIYSIVALSSLVFLFKNKIIIDLNSLKRIGESEKFILLVITLTILLPILFTALYYPPNNWDSMTYHMARIMHWIDNKDVNFYFTQNDRQLYSGPLAEYVILHWYLLTDSDIFSNLVQYFSLIVTTCASYLITKFLSKDKKINLLSIVLVLTTPMAIMQASSTQNDLVVSSILLSTIYLGYKKSWLLFGLSIGLGMLTKNTYAIFALPFCLYFGIKWLKEYKQKALLLFFWFLLCVIFINTMHWHRNYQEFGSPVGSKKASELTLNQNLGAKFIFSNMIKNTGLQLGTPSQEINVFIDRIILKIHKVMSIDFDDSRNSFLSLKYQTRFAIHEDVSGNLILMVLILICIALCLFLKKNMVLFYCLNILGGWFLYNIILKWQPWGTRLLLPWFLLSIPFISTVIKKLYSNHHSYIIFIQIVLIFCAYPFIAGSNYYFGNFPLQSNSNRQIIPLPEFGRGNRAVRYFYGKQNIYNDFKRIVDEINKLNLNTIALDVDYDGWEYPWWIYLKENNLNKNISILILDKITINDINKYDLIVSDGELCKSSLIDANSIQKLDWFCWYQAK